MYATMTQAFRGLQVGQQIELIDIAGRGEMGARVWMVQPIDGSGRREIPEPFMRRNSVPSSIELRTYGGLESGTISGRDMTDIADDAAWRADAVQRIDSGDVGQSPYDTGLALALAGF